jgi:hypothetical protein
MAGWSRLPERARSKFPPVTAGKIFLRAAGDHREETRYTWLSAQWSTVSGSHGLTKIVIGRGSVTMGYSISWIAFQGKSKQEVLTLTNLVDTGEPDQGNDSSISGAELTTGWYVLFLNNFSHPYVSAMALQRFSAGCVVLGCQVEEHVMASAAFLYERGTRRWKVAHESEKGIYHVDVDGSPPQFFASLRAELSQVQDQKGGEDAEVDFMFDVPLALAAKLCGYRHDRWKFEWGEPTFTRLEIAHS